MDPRGHDKKRGEYPALIGVRKSESPTRGAPINILLPIKIDSTKMATTSIDAPRRYRTSDPYHPTDGSKRPREKRRGEYPALIGVRTTDTTRSTAMRFLSGMVNPLSLTCRKLSMKRIDHLHNSSEYRKNTPHYTTSKKTKGYVVSIRLLEVVTAKP